MFMSSCYWPPAPIDAPLASPWSENVTTFGEALHFMIPNLPEEMMPDNIPILDRCWCDFSARAFFKPFNTTQWEVDSLVRVKEELERRLEDDAKDKQLDASAHVDETDAMAVTNYADDASPARRENIWDRVWSFTQRTDTSSNAPSAPVKASAGGPALEANLTSPPGEASSLTPQTDTSLPLPDKRPLFRLEYDLRPYGLSMVVDFGWSTVTS
ncbi:hypothetical protein A0H81_00360 [Grifola frondosa]|uniref:Uncharacterized protein n=1 Tax=Grifola frondosa TaxID=5627 RepID=A0A1C7MQ57_GRIFR|nr:hypothetical protein A0H81_00360 [Grifola frondosa]